jgi:Flp pilus assembly protein TadD
VIRAGLLVIIQMSAGLVAACSHPAPAPQVVTFNKDIAPIVFANCTPCHRKGEIGPFQLLTYADAVDRAGSIAKATRERQMPPWLPDSGDDPIVGDRRLRADQIDLIQRWVQGGKLEGNAADLPPAPVFPNDWQSGKPDVVVTPAQPFPLTPGTEDLYRNFVVRTRLSSSVYVRAVEFKTNGAPIHHAVIRVDRTSVSRRRDGEDGQPGFEGMLWDSVQDPGGQFIGWAPGRGPIVSPEGMPWRLDRGADLVIELHMIRGKAPVPIQPTIGLFFTDTPPVKTPLTVKMSSKSIDIAAGATDYVVTETVELPVPVKLLSLYPHAHNLGKEMTVTATRPDGTVKTLLHIPQWSFHWQQPYQFVTPIALPRGTRITMRYTFDNSDANDENPHHPPVRVLFGPRSVDEMAELGLQVITESGDDSDALWRAFNDHERNESVLAAEARARQTPDSADAQAILGAAYVDVGRFADAVTALGTALRLNEKSANAHSDLGTALLNLGRTAEAVVHLQRAVALAPKNETMQFNLGNALNTASRWDDAAAAFNRALAINADYTDAHVNLAALQLSRGRVADAVAHMQRAAELEPDSAFIHTSLSSALAAAGRPAEALQHVQKALQLKPGYPPALENLKRLQRRDQ